MIFKNKKKSIKKEKEIEIKKTVILKECYYKQGSSFLQRYWSIINAETGDVLDDYGLHAPHNLVDRIQCIAEKGYVLKDIKYLDTHEIEHLADLNLYYRLEEIRHRERSFGFNL